MLSNVIAFSLFYRIYPSQRCSISSHSMDVFMNCQSMSIIIDTLTTVPCFESSNEISDMLLLDSQVELVVLFVFLSKFLVDAASSTPVYYCISYNYREGPSLVLTLRVKLFAWHIHWEKAALHTLLHYIVQSTSPSPTHFYKST